MQAAEAVKETGPQDSAVHLFQQSLALFNKHGNHLYDADIHNDIAYCYLFLKQYDSAKHYLEVALQENTGQNGTDIRSRAVSFNHLDFYYGYTGLYDSCFFFFNTGLKLQQQHLPPDDKDIATSYENLAWYNAKKGDYRNTLSFTEKALKIKVAQLGRCSFVHWDFLLQLGFLLSKHWRFRECHYLLQKSSKSVTTVTIFFINGTAWGKKCMYNKTLLYVG